MPDKESTVEEMLEALRSRGWRVAVHNDYHTQLGGWCTFWLFTNGWLTVKGEGKTDRESLRLAICHADCVEKAAAAAHDRGVHLPEFVNLKPGGLGR